MSVKESKQESIILNGNAYNEISLTDIIAYLDVCHYLKIKPIKL